MKNKIRFLAMMLIGVLLSVNQVWGGSYSLSGSEFGTSNVSSYAAGPATLTGADGGKWTVTGYGVTANTNVIIGKGGANYLQTPECSGNITSVVVTWSGNTSYYLALQTTSGTELEAQKNTSGTTYTFNVTGEYKQLRLVGRRSSGTSNAAATITAVTVNYSSGSSKKTVYLDCSGQTGWPGSAYLNVWDGSSDVELVKVNDCNNDYLYSAEVASATTYYFKRYNAGNHGEKWNEISISLGTHNCCKVNSGDGGWNSGTAIDYTAPKFTVTCHPNGGDGGDIVVSNKACGDKVNLASTPTRTGWTFLGWYDGSGNRHDAGEEVTVSGNMEYWAHWEAYVLHGNFTGSWTDNHFYVNNDYAEINLAAGNYEFGIAYRETDKSEVWKGQTGTSSMTRGNSTWTLNGSNNVKIAADVAGTYRFEYNTSTASMTVTYPALPVTVTFKNNGETLATGGTRQVPSGQAIGTLPVLTSGDACDYASRTFVGWTATEIMTKTDVEPTLIDASTIVNADITYHAVWAEGTTSTFDAATLENLTEDDEYWEWTENTTGVEMGIYAGQRYTGGSPYTFTITAGTNNYFYVEHATAKINTLTVTLSGTNYKIGSVSNGTLTTNGTTQTVTGINATQVNCYATNSQQIRATKIVATTATNYITKCATTATIKTYDGSTLLQTLTDQTLNVAVTPTAPSAKTGYDFVGWNEDQEATTGSMTFTPTVAKEYTLYAIWQAHKHTLTYANTEGATIGNGTAAGQVAYGAALTTPTNVTKPGYDFAGWSANLPATMPDEDVTITASWNPHTYTATVQQDGGTGITAMTVTYLDNKLVITGTSTKDEFKLTGYLIGSTPIADKDGNLLPNVSGYTNAEGQWIGTSNPTIKVEWTAITWTDYLTDCSAPYTWTIWYQDPSDSQWKDAAITDGQAQFTLAKESTFNFKIRKTNDGENYTYYGASSDDNRYTTSGTSWTLDHLNSEGYDVHVVTGAAGVYTINVTNMTGDAPQISVTYPTAYTITFAGNGADGGSMTNVTNIAAGENVALAANAYTKTGNHFKGWVADVDVTISGSPVSAGTLIADGATIQNINSNITLTAQWETKVTALMISQESGIYEIVAGETLQLTLTVTPNDAEYGTTYAWHSSNGSTMTVDQYGLVTGVQANTGAYIYVTNNDGVESNHYVINVKSAACDTWGLHMWNEHESTFRDSCFTQVGSTTEWRTQQVTLPSNSNDEKVEVLYAGISGYHSAKWITRMVPTVGYQQGGCSDASDGNRYAGQDAKGYFRIYSDSESDNYYLAFQPVYAVIYGVEGQTWQQVEFTDTETANNFYTDIITVPEGYNSNVKIYAGTSKASGVNFISGRSSTVNMNTITGLTGSGMAGKAGKFKINDNYCNESNFNLSFERYYRLNYNLDEGAGTGDYSDQFALPSASAAERTFTLETAPTKDGFTFRGWSVSIGGGEATTQQPGETVVLTEDAVVTAQWAKNYTVTYDLDGYSTSCSSSTVHYCDEEVTVCDAPEDKTGYTFMGWNTDDITGSPADFEPGYEFIMPCHDVVFTADYQADSYTITYLDQNGDAFSGTHGANHPTTHTYGTATTLVNPTKTGYTFGGWYLDEPCTGAQVTILAADGYTNNITLYAKWEIQTFTVTFSLNGGQGLAPSALTEVPYNSTISAPDAPADYEDGSGLHTFAGWYKENTCDNAWNFASDVVIGNTTLYAKWSGVTYEDYRTHCCTPLDAPTGGAASNIHMTTATLSWNAVSGNNGYQVSADQVNWENVLDGTSYKLTGLTAGTHYIYYVRAIGGNDEYCLYGTAAQIEFTTKAALHITYTANGGTGEEVVSGDIEEGTSATVAANTFGAPTGMTFNGWNTQAEGDGTAYDEGDVINPLNADLTLYAQWIGAEYNVTYDLVGGTGGCTSTTATYNSEFTICSAIPTKGTDAFTGWSSNVEIGGKSTFQPGETFTMPASNVTLTAQWAASYTVTYVINNVEVSGPNPAGDVYVAQGQSTTLPDFEFSCGLYNQFIGWVNAEVAEQDEKIACPDLVGKAGDPFTPTGNITLYALFGHDAENLGWVKQTTISSGKYLMANENYVMTGFNTASNTSTTNYATVTSATNTGSFATKPDGAVELEVIAGAGGTFAMKYGTDYIAATGGNYLNYQAGVSNEWTLLDGNTKITDDLGTPAAGAIYTSTYTRVIYYNSSRFAAYANASGKQTVYLYKLINEGYYTTSPTCEIPTSVTVTYNKNTEDEVTMCDNAELHFTTYPHLTEAYTLCAAADVVREGYVLRTWNTAANGSGKDYAPGTEFTELGNNLNLYAQWDRVYTVTLHDNGETRPLTQASEGAAINLGRGKDEGDCDLDGDDAADFTWTFVGWTTNNTTLVEYPVCPEVVANPSEYVPDANIDLYAVYSRPIENTTAFAAGVSGAYIVKDNSNAQYLGAKTTGATFTFNAVTAESDAIVIKLVKNNGSYNVATDAGFVEWNNSTSMRYEQSMNGHWTISGSAGNWSMRESVNSRYLCWNQVDKFNLQQSNRTVDLIPTTGTYYFSNPVCQDKFDITFDVRGGDINYGEAIEEDYKDLARGAQVTDFPTIDMRDDLMDWTFVGWTTLDYNTQHALDEENASTEAPTSIIYRTGGANTFTMPSTNVTLYPVFTSAIANEPMDLENGGDYYVYFTSDQDGYHDPYTKIDGHTIRVYAQNTGGKEAPAAFASTTSCANAQLFHFEQREAGKWDIRLWNSVGDAYIINSYLTNPGVRNNDFASQATQPEGYWTIEQLSDGSFKAQYSVNAGTKYFMKGWVNNPTTQASATFKCYSEDCDNSEHFYEVYLGSCVERTFSADPMPQANLHLTGMVNVTSRTGVAVRATNFLTLKGIKLEAGQKVTISSTNSDIYFSDTKAVNMSKAAKPVNPLQITVPESGSMEKPIYVHYQPTATVDGIEQVDVVAFYSYATTELEKSVNVKVRHLPEQVVIAAKVNDQWYALPANLSGATNPLVTPITVNEATMKAEAPTNCAYTLWPVKTTATVNDRYQEVGERVRFSATNNGNKGLWSSDAVDAHTTINNYAVIDGIAADPAAPNYEWVISTNDLNVYTLTATGVNNTSDLSVTRPTSGGNQGQLVWGTYGTNVTAEVYLLPFTAFTDMQATVVEWFQDKVLVELTNGDIWTAMSGASAQTQSQIGSAEWGTESAVDYTTYGTNMCTFNTGSLTSSYGQNLSIKTVVDETTYRTTLVVPIIIGSNKSVTGAPFTTITPNKYNTMDVVVRDGAVLTLNGTSDEQTTFNMITVEPSSKVVVNEGRNLGASLITLRGGYDEIYSGGSYTMGYDEPQLYIGGTCSATQVNYEKRVNLDQMHGMSVPFEVEQTAISYLNGTSVKEGGNLYIDAYDGEKRAQYSGAQSSWYYYDAKTTPLYRGIGYTISAEPAVEGQNYTILRAPMATGWTKAVPGSESVAGVAVQAWGLNTDIHDNHKGWNCLGNPYMANFGKADDATFGGKLYVGQLVKTLDDKGNWTGGYHWDTESTVRYVTIPHDDGHGFEQVRVQDAVLKPFRHFFVQVQTDGTLQFAKENIQNSVIARVMNDEPEEIELGILMSNGQVTDNCGLLIGEGFSEGYEMMNDLGKELGQAMAIYTITGDYKLAFNAMNETYAKGYIPVGYLAPKAGEYTISFDNDRYDIAPCVEHIYLLENGSPVADLKSVDYNFETKAGMNDDRFALNIVFNHNIGTDLSGTESMNEMPVKIVHNDKMYILMHGRVYSTTGKFIKEIKK